MRVGLYRRLWPVTSGVFLNHTAIHTMLAIYPEGVGAQACATKRLDFMWDVG